MTLLSHSPWVAGGVVFVKVRVVVLVVDEYGVGVCCVVYVVAIPLKVIVGIGVT